jgi:CRP-like cAMP-binding protein
MSTELGPQANALLRLLDEADLRGLVPHLERVPLPLEQVLYEEGKPMLHAWFPGSGVLSVLGAGAQTHLEVGTIGAEGVLGVPLSLGAETSPGPVFVQVPGWGWRMEAQRFRAAVASDRGLAAVVRRYTHAFMVQVMQGTACNRAHDPAQRCARWLLQTDERVAGDEFELKQEFLGQMLGERRATVSRVASELQARGLIRYSRARVRVMDRAGLRASACPCYGIVRDEYTRMLGAGALRD